MATIRAELTDTFGGEANYAWVKRETFTVPDHTSSRAIVRRAKAALGLTNVRCRTTDLGDSWELRPYGWCAIAFISYEA